MNKLTVRKPHKPPHVEKRTYSIPRRGNSTYLLCKLNLLIYLILLVCVLHQPYGKPPIVICPFGAHVTSGMKRPRFNQNVYSKSLFPVAAFNKRIWGLADYYVTWSWDISILNQHVCYNPLIVVFHCFYSPPKIFNDSFAFFVCTCLT